MTHKTTIDTADIPDGRIQFIIVMSIPEADDGEEICEFPGYQWVQRALQN